MAATLVQAIIEMCDSISELPEMYLTDVPEDKPIVPSTVLVHGGEIPKYHVGKFSPTSEQGSFTIIIYATEGNEAERLALAVKEAFKTNALNLDTDDNARCYRELYKLEGLKERDPDGRRVYRAMLVYSVIFNTDR